MYKDGYFREGIVTLDPQHELRNYEKSIKWLEEGILPGFLKEDMKKYMIQFIKTQSQDKLLTFYFAYDLRTIELN